MKLDDLVPVALPADARAILPEEVVLGRGVRGALVDAVERHIGVEPLLVGDPDTLAAAGPLELAHRLLDLGDHPHADDETVRHLRAARGDAPGYVAVGSGTINDLCKRAAALDGVPFVVLGTAASMNGYASGIAAILSDGLKTTVPSRPARAVILDTDILAAAPARLAQAGLGDLLSKPVSDSDWWLADQLEGTGYSTLPGQVVDRAVEAAAQAAAGLAARDPEAHGRLGEALTLSGVAMVVAGSSAPASGGEHLLSHLWDMEAIAADRETRLHGAQVGVTTLISAALYRALIALETPTFTPPPPWAQEEVRIRAAFGGLAEAIMPQTRRKHARAGARLAILRKRWAEIRSQLAERAIPGPDALRATLKAAGAPASLAELNEPRANAARVFRLARDIRDRVTVLDLAFEVGLLPASIDAVLDAAGV